MSYVYTAVAVYYDPDDPLRFKNLSKTPTVTAKDLSTGTAIAGATVSNVDTGNYKVSVTYANKESVLFKIVPHNDDKDDFPDVSLLAEEVRFVADDILADTGDLKTRLTAARAGYLDKLNVAGTLAHSGAAGTYKADVSSLALEATLTAIKGAGWTNETLKAIKDAADSGGGGGATPQQIWEYANRELSTPSNYKADLTTLESRLTANRAGYLDKLNVPGTLANTNNAGTFKADVSGIPAAVWGFATRTLSGFGTLVSDIWSFATRTLSAFGFTVATSSDANVTAIKAKTDNLPASPAAVGSAMILTSAYDKAKDDVLTPLGVIDGKADAIKLQTDKIPNTPAVTGEYTSALTAIQADLNDPDQYKADVSALAKVTDLSGLAEKTDIPSDYAKVTDLSGLAEKTDIPNDYSKASALATVDGKVDGIKTKTDNLPNSPAATGDAMTLTSAYDNAKADVLTPLATVDGKADAIKAKTDKIPNMPAEAGEYTSALTDIQTDLDNPNQYKADVSGLALEATLTAIKGANWTDETLVTIKDIVDNISSGVLTAAGIRTAIGLASNNLDAQLSAIQSDLDDPSQYKADVSGLATSGALTTVDGKVNAIKAKTDNLPVSPAATGDKMLLDADALDATAIKADAVAKLQDGLALESTLSEIKGVGWTDETLKAIKDATGGGGLDAQGVRDAVGLANANLDTQLEAIQDDLDDPNQYKADVSGLATSAALSSVDGKVDSIKAATDKIPNTPAVAGEYDGALAAIQDDLDDPDQYKADVSAIVNILEDIKGAGWTDETLEAIADAITNVPGGEGVLEALESIRSELRQYSAVRRHLKCDRLEIKRATDATIEVFGVGDLTGRSSLYFTVKYMKDKDTAADMHSVIQIEETAGLLYINQVEADTPANGSIVVSDALAGTMTIKLSAAETDKLTPNESYVYDIKMDNDVMAEGKLLISTAVTRTVT